MAVSPVAAQEAAEDPWLSASVEYLLWKTRPSPSPPPVVSTGPLGQAGTQTLLGNRSLAVGEQHGVRVTVAMALDDDRDWTVEARYFFLPERTERRTVIGPGTPESTDLVIPFFDVTLPGENTTFLSSAGHFSGVARETLSSRLHGGELNLAWRVVDDADWRVDTLGGLRYLGFHERYEFATSSPNLPPAPRDIFRTRDRFDASNDFYGGQVGVRASVLGWRWWLEIALSVAVGAMRQSVDIDGVLRTTDLDPSGHLQTFPGGYFAQPTNMGDHQRTMLAVVPELSLGVGFHVTSWLQVFAGYTFLYASDAVRATDQVEREINPSQSLAFGGTPPATLAGPARPRFRFHSSDLWAQGLNVGVAIRY